MMLVGGGFISEWYARPGLPSRRFNLFGSTTMFTRFAQTLDADVPYWGPSTIFFLRRVTC
jgi:hypothetical protein